MTEHELADRLSVSERKLREMRDVYCDVGQHWSLVDGLVTYTPAGVAMLVGALGLDVVVAQDKPRQDAPGSVQECQDKGGEVQGPLVGQPDAAAGLTMVVVSVVRLLPNGRQYVGQVVGTRRIVRLKTRSRMGLKKGRRLWCIDQGAECVFDRVAARKMGAVCSREG